MDRKNLAMMVMEDAEGRVSVQFFTNPEKAQEMFGDLTKATDGKNYRATLLALDFEKGKVEAFSKNLPLPRMDVEKMPDGHRLGTGPIHFQKEQKA